MSPDREYQPDARPVSVLRWCGKTVFAVVRRFRPAMECGSLLPLSRALKAASSRRTPKLPTPGALTTPPGDVCDPYSTSLIKVVRCRLNLFLADDRALPSRSACAGSLRLRRLAPVGQQDSQGVLSTPGRRGTRRHRGSDRRASCRRPGPSGIRSPPPPSCPPASGAYRGRGGTATGGCVARWRERFGLGRWP